MFSRPCYRKIKGKRQAYWTLVESDRTDRGPASERLLGLAIARTPNGPASSKQRNARSGRRMHNALYRPSGHLASLSHYHRATRQTVAPYLPEPFGNGVGNLPVLGRQLRLGRKPPVRLGQGKCKVAKTAVVSHFAFRRVRLDAPFPSGESAPWPWCVQTHPTKGPTLHFSCRLGRKTPPSSFAIFESWDCVGAHP